MGFFQVGFEITRLPKDTNLSTPMFPHNMANTNTNTNTNDSTAGIRVGIGSSVFQVAGSVCSDRFAMASMLSGVYIVAASRVAYGMVTRSNHLAGSPPSFFRPALAVVGVMMGSAFVTTVLPKPHNNHQGPTDSESP